MLCLLVEEYLRVCGHGFRVAMTTATSERNGVTASQINTDSHCWLIPLSFSSQILIW